MRLLTSTSAAVANASAYVSPVVALGRVDQRLRHEAQRLQRLAIAPQCDLVLGSTFNVFEHESWYAPPGNLAQIRDVECSLDVAGGPAAPGHVRVVSGKLHDVYSIGGKCLGGEIPMAHRVQNHCLSPHSSTSRTS